MNTNPYDPKAGTLCAPCITPLYQEISLSVISGIALGIYTLLGFFAHNVRTIHFSRKIVKLHIVPIERILFNLLLISLWSNEFFLIHFWRLSPITVACPPSSVYIGVKIVNDVLCCFLFSVAIFTRNHYIYRFYTWIPNVIQSSSIFVYYLDAISREDICWSSFAVIPSIIIGLLNIINIPYILSGGSRIFLGEELEINSLALKHREETQKEYRGDERRKKSALMRESSQEYNEIELEDMRDFSSRQSKSYRKGKLPKYSEDDSSDESCATMVEVPLSTCPIRFDK